jgi:hypothetical protein
MTDLVSIDDLLPDSDNANLGTVRGSQAIVDSLTDQGFGRGVVTDCNGLTIAGNKTLEAAKLAGITKIRVVKTRGDEIVVNQREDLDLNSMVDNRGRKLALNDNRIGAISQNIDMKVVNRQIAVMNIDPGQVNYTIEELRIGPPAKGTVSFQAGSGSGVGESYQVVIHCGNESDQREVFERLKGEGLDVRLVVI